MAKKPDITLKPKANPLLASLPDHLKDHANYERIQRSLLETLATAHSHSDILEWGTCIRCQKKLKDHADMQYKLGFTSPAQYYAWKKTHEKIAEYQKVKLPKYNDN